MSARAFFEQRIPEACRAPLLRDLPATAARATFAVMALSLGPQLVQELGGLDVHVAAVRAAPAVGLLLSIGYVRLGRGRSPLALAFWPEAIAMLLLASLGFIYAASGSPALYTVVTCSAISLATLMLPLLSTVYGLVYSELHRARLIAYGRTVNGFVAVVGKRRQAVDVVHRQARVLDRAGNRLASQGVLGDVPDLAPTRVLRFADPDDVCFRSTHAAGYAAGSPSVAIERPR